MAVELAGGAEAGRLLLLGAGLAAVREELADDGGAPGVTEDGQDRGPWPVFQFEHDACRQADRPSQLAWYSQLTGVPDLPGVRPLRPGLVGRIARPEGDLQCRASPVQVCDQVGELGIGTVRAVGHGCSVTGLPAAAQLHGFGEWLVDRCWIEQGLLDESGRRVGLQGLHVQLGW